MDLSAVRIRTTLSPRLAELYPGQQPFVFTAPLPWRDGGPDPLSGVGVFAHPDGHLHYVGFGLREAGGFAFELTFRLAGEASVPAWPVRLMNEFARHAIKTRRPLSRGQYLCLSEPVDPRETVRCAALVPDPQLTSDGWLQIVGLHEDELSVMSGDGYERLLAELAPLFVTIPGRPALVASER